MTTRTVRCTVCGAPGEEDETDPCPGVCPLCFEGLLQHETLALIHDRLRVGRTISSCLARSMTRLRKAGLTPEAALAAQAFLEAALARDLAEERRVN
jgi:hypothetical protein